MCSDISSQTCLSVYFEVLIVLSFEITVTLTGPIFALHGTYTRKRFPELRVIML